MELNAVKRRNSWIGKFYGVLRQCKFEHRVGEVGGAAEIPPLFCTRLFPQRILAHPVYSSLANAFIVVFEHFSRDISIFAPFLRYRSAIGRLALIRAFYGRRFIRREKAQVYPRESTGLSGRKIFADPCRRAYILM